MKKQYDKELSIEALAAIPDDQIDTSDIPELTDADLARANPMTHDWTRFDAMTEARRRRR